MLNTTTGQVLINAVLPEHLRDYSRVLDKKGIDALTEQLADEKNPELYRKVMHALYSVGHMSAQSGGASFSLYDLRTPVGTKVALDKLKDQVTAVTESDTLTPDQREAAVVKLVGGQASKIEQQLYDEALKSGNAFAQQVHSGSRGKKGDLRSLLVGDLLVSDHKDRIIPMPITNSYSQGVDPAQFWAGAYGARRGTIATKFQTSQAGFLAKQLSQAAHTQVVTSEDCETSRGIPVPADDPDNIGTVLSATAGGLPAGTVLGPREIRKLKGKTISVRSPLTCEANDGVCGRCAGIREKGGFPEVGDNIGITAAQSLSERLSQTQLSKKHSAGRADYAEEAQGVQGFDLINQMVQVPKAFREAATIARTDGTVKSVSEAPQGGQFVVVGDEQHYIPPKFKVFVKPGDRVDAGDVISEGLPNPMELVKYRGIGAGRLEFTNLFRDAFRKQGMPANRRNIELVARGLINHVRVTDLDGPNNTLPDDIVEYTSIERNYRPRYGHRKGMPKISVGNYLERPVNQYSIGTRVTKRVAKDLENAGIREVSYHKDPPPFVPQMVRAMETLTMSPDFQQRMAGSYLQKGLLESVHRGRSSQISGPSYIPGLMRGKGFGDKLKTHGVY